MSTDRALHSCALRAILVLPVSLLACSGGQPRSDSGVAVGNPGSMRARAGHDDTVRVDAVRLVASQTQLEACTKGGRATLGPTDQWGESGETLPAGDWCALDVRSANLEIDGAADGRAFMLDANVGRLRIEFAGPLPLDAGGLLLQLGGPGWLTANTLGTANGPLRLKPNDPLTALLVSSLDRSVLYVDRDGDGEVGEADAPISMRARASEDEAVPLPNGMSTELQAVGLQAPTGALGEELGGGRPAPVDAAHDEAGRGLAAGDTPPAGADTDAGPHAQPEPDETPSAGDDTPDGDGPEDNQDDQGDQGDDSDADDDIDQDDDLDLDRDLDTGAVDAG